AVFSRTENALFVLGGTDRRTSATLSDIWMQQVDPPGSWTEVRLRDTELGTIVDASWSHRDHRLWVLDVREVEGDTMFRLVRIDPYLGAAQVIGEWPRRADAEHRWLVVDRDGQVLLVSSSSSAARHTVMRFEVSPFEDAVPARAALSVREGH